MINKLITLFKIGRKLALSDALDIVSKIYKIPIIIKIFLTYWVYLEKKFKSKIIMKKKDCVDQWSPWVLLSLNLDNS